MPPPTATQKPGIVGAIGKAATAVKDAVVGDKKAGNGSAAAAPPTTGTGGGKPNQNKYNAEQEEYNKEIAGVKAKLVSCGTAPAIQPIYIGYPVMHLFRLGLDRAQRASWAGAMVGGRSLMLIGRRALSDLPYSGPIWDGPQVAAQGGDG
jgi:hypothetical protein